MSYNDSQNKKIAKNTFFLNIRLIIVLLINIYISRVVLQVLGVEDYGLYNLVGGFVSLLSILTNSITGTAARFITYELGKGNLEKLSNTFSTIVNIIIFLAIFVILIGGLLGPWIISRYLNIPIAKANISIFVFVCSLVVFFFNLLSIPYTAIITAYERMGFYAFMSIIESVGKLILVISLTYSSVNNLQKYAVGIAFVAFGIRLIYKFYCNKHFPESRYKFYFDKKAVKKIFSFSAWVGIGSAVGVLKDQGINILLNLFFGLTLNAAMGIANQVKGMLEQFINNIGAAISPQITKTFASNNLDRSIRLTFLQAKCQGIFGILIIAPMLSETQYILGLWLGHVPFYTVVFVRLLLIVCFINSISIAYGPLFLANGKIRNYQIYATCVLALFIPACYLLLKVYNNPAVCMYVSIFTESLFLVTNYLYMYKILKFPTLKFFKNVVFPVFISFILVLFMTRIATEFMMESFWRLLISGLISSVFCLICSTFFILETSERSAVFEILRKK